MLAKMNEKTDSPDLSLELCGIYLKQGRFEETGKLLKVLFERFPGSAAVKNFYAYFLAGQGKDLKRALELSAGTLSGAEDEPAYLDTYGYLLLRLGREQEAGTFLEKAYRLSPFDADVIDHVVEYYRWKKQDTRIIEVYQKAIDNGVDFKDRLNVKIEEIKNEK
jgi:tetratricopeptide (TPR) repeat protein